VIRLALVTIAGLLITTTVANAAFCADGHPSVEAEYAVSTFVVEAKVVSIKHDLGKGRHKEYWELYDRITLLVTKSYKGAGRTLSFNSTHDSARVPVGVGDDVLMFIRRDPDGKNYVDTCGSSDVLARVDKNVFPELEQLASSDHQKARP
jgi:hypothetical protein